MIEGDALPGRRRPPTEEQRRRRRAVSLLHAAEVSAARAALESTSQLGEMRRSDRFWNDSSPS